MDKTDYENTILHGDSLEIMKQLPDECVDLVITSPPYNLRNTSGGGFQGNENRGNWQRVKLRNGYADHDDNMPHDQYVAWQRACLTEMMRLIPETGAIFYNHKWRVQNGLIQDRADIVEGFPVRQIIIWDRGSGMNFSQSFFCPNYEVIYLIAKPKFRLIKGACGMGDVWRINAARNDHPAPFPVEIPDRIIRATDAKIVLDPFMGSGTTAVAAKQNGRNYIGIELSQKYIDMAQERLSGLVLFLDDN